jgi:hypothetical protein
MTTHILVQLTLLAVFVGCASAPGPAYNDSWDSLRAAVVNNLPQGVTATSLNGRTFTSGYYDPKNQFIDATKKPVRAQATVTVLGGSRPYHLEASVEVFKRTRNGEYDDEGPDDKLADELVMRIQKDLAHRREGRDVIDDFRAF